MATDEQIEKEIQAKGLTAPRVTLESIAAKIKSEWYFTAAHGVEGMNGTDNLFGTVQNVAGIAINAGPIPESLLRLTFCVLVLENGFTVTGKSAPASAANFDQELGRKIAKQDAVNQIWPLEGYLLRELLAEDERREKAAAFSSDKFDREQREAGEE